MFDHTEATNIVTLLYRRLLDRDPDHSALQQHVDTLVSRKRTVAEIFREFTDLPDFKRKRPPADPQLTSFQSLPDAEVFVPADVAQQLFDKTSYYWRNTASQPDQIYWSVITQEQWKRTLTDEDRARFVETGKPYANRVLKLYQQYAGQPLDNVSCIDFGSGVGRLAINFAARVGHVHAVDFSESHLEELQRNAALLDCASRIDTWPIRSPGDLDKLPQVDLVYSFIALQHNTPPVIATMMRALLDKLRPGGYAFLHVTLAKIEYGGFSVQDYLASPKAGTTMEVHILPRANINTLAARAGCTIVTSHCIGGNSHAYSEEIVFHRPPVV